MLARQKKQETTKTTTSPPAQPLEIDVPQPESPPKPDAAADTPANESETKPEAEKPKEEKPEVDTPSVNNTDGKDNTPEKTDEPVNASSLLYEKRLRQSKILTAAILKRSQSKSPKKTNQQ